MDWISEGTTALISGMSAVFMILILISLMISGLGSIGKLEKKTVKEMPEHIRKQVTETANTAVQEDENRRLTAAITVALANELGRATDTFVVRKLRRL